MEAGEREPIEEQLKQNERKYRELVEQSALGIAIAQGDPPRLVFANSAMATITGYSVDELISLSSVDFLGIVHPGDRAMFIERFRARIEGTDISPSWQFRILNKKGELRWLEFSCKRIERQGQPAVQATFADITDRKKAEVARRNERDKAQKYLDVAGVMLVAVDTEQRVGFVNKKGCVIAALSSGEDITERKQTERALAESEEHFRSIFENSVIGMYRTTPDGRILMANTALVKMLGYASFEELAQRNLEQEGFEPDYPRSEFKWRIDADDQVMGLESHWIRRDGTTLFVRESARIVRDGPGEGLYYEGTVEDITERKRGEDRLRGALAWQEAIFEGSRDAVLITNADSKFIMVNHRACELTGYSEQELLGMSIPELHERQDLTAYDLYHGRIMSGEEIVSESKLLRKDGTKVDAEFSNRCVSISGETYMHTIARDITERKQAEEALRESKKRYAQAARRARFGYWERDIADGTAVWSVETCDIFGVDDEEFEPTFENFLSLVHPSDRESLKIAGQKTLSIGKKWDMEYRIIRPDGEERHIHSISEAACDEKEEPTRLAGTVHDITDRKRAEDALRCSEQKFKTVIDHSAEVFFIQDTNHELTYVSPQCEEIFGYTPEEMMVNWTTLITDSPVNEKGVELTKRAIKTGRKLGPYLLEISRKDGKLRIVEVDESPVKDEDGKVVAITGAVRDVTVREKAEEKANARARLNRILLDAMPSVAMLIRPYIREVVACNEKAAEMGVIPGKRCFEAWGDGEPCSGCLAPQLWETGQPQQREVEKSARVWDARWVPVSENLYMYYAYDITERKQAEQALRASQLKLKGMASRILHAEDHERRRIAIGLHDNICQKLVLTKLALESSADLISNNDASSLVNIACGAIGEAIEEADSLTFALSNPVLRELGFVAALQKYLDEEIRQKHGLVCDFEGDEQSGVLPDEIKNCLFRVSRELLTNVVKHAQARLIRVSVRKSRGCVRVSIQDDGVGFQDAKADSRTSATGRFGLFSVREQLEYLGGRLKIESELGRGATVTVVVPLRKKQSV